MSLEKIFENQSFQSSVYFWCPHFVKITRSYEPVETRTKETKTVIHDFYFYSTFVSYGMSGCVSNL